MAELEENRQDSGPNLITGSSANSKSEEGADDEDEAGSERVHQNISMPSKSSAESELSSDTSNSKKSNDKRDSDDEYDEEYVSEYETTNNQDTQ